MYDVRGKREHGDMDLSFDKLRNWNHGFTETMQVALAMLAPLVVSRLYPYSSNTLSSF